MGIREVDLTAIGGVALEYISRKFYLVAEASIREKVRGRMREIKFRGKRIDNGEWVYGNYFIDERDIEDGFIWRDIPQIQQRYGDHYQYYDVDPSTVGQYTGLKDKNGKEIYEGDIVEYKDFSDGLYVFKEQPKTKGIIKISNLLSGIYLKGMGTFKGRKVEIIGNIHDNPDLLAANKSSE